MKSVLISIRPKWCEKIASGKKTIEVRKTVPKEVPFKAYIYCTDKSTKDNCWQFKPNLYIEKKTKNPKWIDAAFNSVYGYEWAQQRVIGEFICDKVQPFVPLGMRGFEESKNTLKETCLTSEELTAYGGLKTLCGWHISDLKIYDKPKDLSEFKTPPCDKPEKACGYCKWLVKINTPDVYECECYVEDGRPITRPPQSWQYVEKLKK